VSAPERQPGATKCRFAWISLGLLLLVALAYAPVWNHDFVSLDDERYVSANHQVQAGLTVEGWVWAWTAFHAANWHPLTWLSHMLDVELFGSGARGHHLTNVALHAANTILLFLLLGRMTGSAMRALVVAVLFGVHPLHVESVAWVAERKDLLCALFWLLAMRAYLAYARDPAPRSYGLVFLLAACALLAKPMAVTLPFVLLLIDGWPLRRFEALGPRRLLLEKLPLLALSIASSVVTLLAQRAGGAIATLDAYPLGVRLANAAVAYATYLGRTIWPAGLALPYPHPGNELPLTTSLLSLLLLAAVSFAAYHWRRERPWLAVGWLWFLGTLVPVIGLVQVGPQAMADRYTYLPLVGIFMMLAWSFRSVGRQVRRETGLAALLLVVTPLATIGTWRQLRHWENDLTLATRAIAVTRDNAVAHNELGLALERRGRSAEALPHYNAAIEIRPGFAEAHNNLAGTLSQLGRFDEALAAYRHALELKPAYPEALLNYGVALARRGETLQAIAQFEQALRIRPGYGRAHANLAAAHLTRDDVEAARREIERARAAGFEPPAGLVEAVELRSSQR